MRLTVTSFNWSICIRQTGKKYENEIYFSAIASFRRQWFLAVRQSIINMEVISSSTQLLFTVFLLPDSSNQTLQINCENVQHDFNLRTSSWRRPVHISFWAICMLLVLLIGIEFNIYKSSPIVLGCSQQLYLYSKVFTASFIW